MWICVCISMCMLLYWTRHKMATGAIFSPAEDIQFSTQSQGMTPRPQLHWLPDTWERTFPSLRLSCSLGLLLAFPGGLPAIWKEKSNWWRSLQRQSFTQSCTANWTGLISEVLNAQIKCLKYRVSLHEMQAPLPSKNNFKKLEESETILRKTPDILHRQTHSTNSGFADRRPCWSVLIIETRKECDKEKLRRDKNETVKLRLLLFCQGMKSRGSEKTQWGIITKPLHELINVSDEQCNSSQEETGDGYHFQFKTKLKAETEE